MQQNARLSHKHQPMYGWALTGAGKPVPISAAKRGQRYICPICRGEVIPRLGDVKQHHFSHISLVDCTPDNVARAVAGVWLAEVLNQKLIKHEPVNITWQTQDAKTSHTVNILKDIDSIATRHQSDQVSGDLVLLNRERKAKVVILLGIDASPPAEKLAAWTQTGITVILLNPVGVRSGQMNLVQLLENSTVMGGWWLMDKTAMPSDLIVEPESLRKTLREGVFRPPHSFFGELHDEGSMSYVLDIDGKKLWL
ncbi:MAG TPA: competence protein CoiA family protein, partial [Aggregatilineales bacterium]|nr:competence protein CoiA family protein [Aggregatilineales bacterium]